MTTKNEFDKTNELLLSIKNLLILQLHSNNVPITGIVKAAKMNTNDIYKIIPKTKPKSKNKKAII